MNFRQTNGKGGILVCHNTSPINCSK